LAAEAEQTRPAQRAAKASACLSIEAITTPTIRPCAAIAIAAVQIKATIFAMAAMLGQKTAQLKMPRPDAYQGVTYL
jgi:hypothetical protein